MKRILLIALLLPPAGGAANLWGRLANPGFEGQRIKATFFFAGPARDGSARYHCAPPGSNTGTYTLTPEPADLHMNWSEPDRSKVMSMLADAGINVITMSSWGEDFLACDDGWVSGAAPMQTSPQAQDELFDAAAARSLLIAPMIESRGNWTMRQEFPRWSDGRVSPGLVSQIVNLVRRYLQNPSAPQRAKAWARVYGHDGAPRYAVGVMHAASDNLPGLGGDSFFAAGLDQVADAVASATGVRVGFFLDATPEGGGLPHASFKLSPAFTAPWLLRTASLLGIECFAPEIFADVSGDHDILAWKHNLMRRWISTNIPVLVDVSPGYNGDIVFGANAHPRYGLGKEWFDGMTAIVDDLARNGMVYNSWNGYTEGMAATPTREKGTFLYDWLKSLNARRTLFVDAAAGGAQSGTATEPFRTIAPANDVSSNGDVISIAAGRYPAAITFTNRLELMAPKGAAVLGVP